MDHEFQPTEAERRVLADVAHSTGITARWVQSLDVERAEVAGLVLPVVTRWFERVADQAVQQDILTLYRGKEARKFVPILLKWLTDSRYSHCRAHLMQRLAELVTASNARSVWTTIKDQEPTSHWGFVASRLARFEPVKVEVIDAIVRRLPVMTRVDLDAVSRLKDERVVRWFQEQTDAVDPVLRRLASRVAQRGLGKGRSALRPSRRTPMSEAERYSIECDLADLPEVLRDIEERYGLANPSTLADSLSLEGLQRDQWFEVKVGSSTYEVWLRPEDVDVVELRVTERAET